MIITKLNILPVCKVVESGTGSGSLSQAIASVIQNSGHLFTFEFSEDRVKNAQTIFPLLKINNITVTHRDVYAEGFVLENKL